MIRFGVCKDYWIFGGEYILEVIKVGIKRLFKQVIMMVVQRKVEQRQKGDEFKIYFKYNNQIYNRS